MDIETILKNVGEVSSRFSMQRNERQRRTALVEADFAELRDAGFLLTGVPVEQGGVWESLHRSARPVCEILRILAHGDPSVALVCAMHPTVLAFWLASPTAPSPVGEAMDGATAMRLRDRPRRGLVGHNHVGARKRW